MKKREGQYNTTKIERKKKQKQNNTKRKAVKYKYWEKEIKQTKQTYFSSKQQQNLRSLTKNKSKVQT